MGAAILGRHQKSAAAEGVAWIRKTILAVAVTIACVLVAASPAQAKVGDQAWAQCVWRTAPVSAANWLGMAVPRWSNSIEPSELLGHRLIAICSTEEANPKKPGHFPNWASLAGTLRRARPAQMGAADLADPIVQLCKSYAMKNGSSSLYKIEIVRVASGARRTVYQQYFTEHAGQAMRVPQDLRMVLGADTPSSTECKAINSLGSLEDA